MAKGLDALVEEADTSIQAVGFPSLSSPCHSIVVFIAYFGAWRSELARLYGRFAQGATVLPRRRFCCQSGRASEFPERDSPPGAFSFDTMSLLRPHNNLGLFVLERKIGEGGMGSVWRGRHLDDHTPVAVKLLASSPVRRPLSIEMFRREVQLVAGLVHPGIVTVFDYGTIPDNFDTTIGEGLANGAPYLVMELASGGTLAGITKPQPFLVLRRILLEILDALAYAHARGVVHRDLKPANVLICTSADLSSGLKLADFGIARPMNTPVEVESIDGSLLGSPPYMPPEQFAGDWRNYGPWTDLYALGCIAYELATGRHPYMGASIAELAQQHRFAPVPKLGAERDGVPAAFDDWVRVLLQKEPEGRFRCAADAAWALAEIDAPAGWASTEAGSVSVADSLDPYGQNVACVTTLGGVIFALDGTKVVRDTVIRSETQVTSPMPTRADADASIPADRGSARSWTRIESRRRPNDDLPSPRTVISEDREFELAIRLGSPPTGTRPPIPDVWPDSSTEPTRRSLVGVGLELFGLRPVPLVGRRAERDRLWQCLRHAATRREPRLLALRGPAGVGKTQLAQCFAERARETGAANVLRIDHTMAGGPGDGMERAISRLLRCDGLGRPGVRRRLLDLMRIGDRWSNYDIDAATELLAPAVNGRVPRVVFASRSERWAIMARILAAYAEERTLVLWCDDVQWGLETLDMIRWWLSSDLNEPVPFVALLTVRSDEAAVPEQTYASISDIVRFAGGEFVELGPIASKDQRGLVTELLGLQPDLAERVVQTTGGNPLFAVQLVGDWVERGVLVPGEDGFELSDEMPTDLPNSIEELWMSRLARVLEEFGRAGTGCVELGALLGEQVEEAEWRRACAYYGLQIPERLVATLADQGLVVRTSDGWRFRHDTLREFVESRIERQTVRPAMHAAIVDALASGVATDSPRALLREAYHVEKSDRIDEAIDLLLEVCRVAEQVSEYLLADRALDRIEQIMARDHVPEHRPTRGMVAVSRARLHARRSAFSEGESLLAFAIEEARVHGWASVEAAALEWSGFVARQRSVLPEAERFYDEAIRAYKRLEDRAGEARSRRGAGWVAILQGRAEEARREITRALDIFEQLEDRYGMASSLRGLGDVARLRESYQEAGKFFARAAEVFDEMGSRHGVSECIHGEAEVHRYLGELEEAAGGYKRSIELIESLGVRLPLIPRLNLGLVELARARFDEARVSLEFAFDRFVARAQWGYAGCAAVCLLPCDAADQNWPLWDEHFDFARKRLGETRLVDPDIAGPAMIGARVALRSNESERATAALELSLEQWIALGNDVRAAEARALLEAIGE